MMDEFSIPYEMLFNFTSGILSTLIAWSLILIGFFRIMSNNRIEVGIFQIFLGGVILFLIPNIVNFMFENGDAVTEIKSNEWPFLSICIALAFVAIGILKIFSMNNADQDQNLSSNDPNVQESVEPSSLSDLQNQNAQSDSISSPSVASAVEMENKTDSNSGKRKIILD